MDETATVAATSENRPPFDGRILHARQDSNLRLPVLETGALAARPRTHVRSAAAILSVRKVEALIPIAEATNGVRSRAHPGAFTFLDSADGAAWCPQQDLNLRPSD